LGRPWNVRFADGEPASYDVLQSAARQPCHGSSDVRTGSKTEVAALWRHVCFAPRSGHRQAVSACPKSADIVAKVENRTTLKISPKLIFGLLCRCVAFQRYYGRP
jgi:hypothetical protein